jgi:CDP-glucose 4,6-dehydratase
MEDMVAITRDFWRDRRVLVTGHTGFKGAWLSLWLSRLGARVTGFSLPSTTSPNLFTLAAIERRIDSQLGDVRDPSAVDAVIERSRAEVVFHLAAQALVRRSYVDPIGTYATNVMGTAHILDSARRASGLRAIVVVTSDKCYENRESLWPFREVEAMGGHDPYSSSKGCAELVTAAWRRSFFLPDSAVPVGLGSARAGNVIGGGDWAEDRLVPDCMRAFASGEPVVLRRPAAVRPWQHVLEPLAGYLILAERLSSDPQGFGEAWNFGPVSDEARPVAWVVDRLSRLWGDGARWEPDPDTHPHEAGLLRVDASKARARLGWTPRLSLEEGLRWTVDWYKRCEAGEDAAALTLDQIERFEALEERL